MATGRRVLVLGASGMIGRAVIDAACDHDGLTLLAASHRRLDGYVEVDYESHTTAAAWVQVLSELRVDAVINCIGIWKGSDESFERVHYTVPTALFDACTQQHLRIVHISALGFTPDSRLPYASTKARADRYLREHCPDGVVILPSLVFGSDGASSRFFLNLAALPVQVDFSYARNLQPVHVDDVAAAVLGAVCDADPPRRIECTGTHAISIVEYVDALRAGMGLGSARVRLRLPAGCGSFVFELGEHFGRRFVNRQTWRLLQDGTQGSAPNPAARPYTSFAGIDDRLMTQDTQLYWFARLGIAFLWLWTAIVTWFVWPTRDTLSWLDSLSPGLGTPFWLGASCVLDAAMGIAALGWPNTRLWQAQFVLTAVYSIGLAFALPWAWSHPFGPLTKNLAVLATLLYLVRQETRRHR